MRFMIVETYDRSKAPAIYERFEKKGRMIPDGLRFIDSWVSADLGRCFQLMECGNPRLVDEWISQWSDIVDFEVIRVVSSEVASELALNKRESLDDNA